MPEPCTHFKKRKRRIRIEKRADAGSRRREERSLGSSVVKPARKARFPLAPKVQIFIPIMTSGSAISDRRQLLTTNTFKHKLHPGVAHKLNDRALAVYRALRSALMVFYFYHPMDPNTSTQNEHYRRRKYVQSKSRMKIHNTSVFNLP